MLRQTSLLQVLQKDKSKIKDNILKHQIGLKVQTSSFPNHIEYTYSTTLKNARWDFGGRKSQQQ